MPVRELELLSPARDTQTARAAILAGADSVYIGANAFGARAEAANSLEDIADLCGFAHVYGCKIYAAINTILTDAELPKACKLVEDLRGAGVDAAIVQDMGLVRECKSPMPFHASTQCHLTTPEKARFLNACGFDTLVLARELALDEIRKIHAAVDNRLECFVHGALCVSYSGQCYLSAAIGGRSGNRGVCAQPCRMKYSLVDSDGKHIRSDAYFLSLRDMNRSKSLRELIDAGVSVFKIEGRLKNADYVKNITAYYRRELDKIIAENPDKYARSSFGESEIKFAPAPEKTFSRAWTEYHLHGVSAGNESFASPKARGEFIGAAQTVFNGGFAMKNADKIFSNGDGLFIEGAKPFGANVQKTAGDKVFLATPFGVPKVNAGDKIWRNKDTAFEKSLQLPMSRRRKIALGFAETPTSWRLSAATENGVFAQIEIPKSGNANAENFDAAKSRFCENISKFGGTPFKVAALDFCAKTLPQLKASQINELRRKLANALMQNILSDAEKTRLASHRRPPQKTEFATTPFAVDKFLNIYNSAAMRFYREMGFPARDYAPETQTSLKGERVMTTRHCILRELGMCKKTNPPKNFKEPFYLENNSVRLRINFDCPHCSSSFIVS